jgi:hypothetical protein
MDRSYPISRVIAMVSVPTLTIAWVSPVSRGRKPKKAKKRPGKGPRPERPTPPAWFEPATKNVLGAARTLSSADGPRELEQRTAELLGAEMYPVLHDGREGLWFEWWFQELVTAAQTSEHGVWLLHGLAAIETSSAAAAACRRARKSRADLPAWLGDLLKVTATGEVFRMTDAYGIRFGVLAGVTHGRGGDSSVFLFDIDASEEVRLASAGAFDDVAQAAAAWREAVGPAAADTQPLPVTDSRELSCLAQWDAGDDMVMGDEPRSVVDNWFRAQRRSHDVAAALRRRGMPLPLAESLYDIDVTSMSDEFIAWHVDRHGGEPDPDVVEAVAAEWMEGALPETWYSVSPRRVAHRLVLISDWIPDDPITVAAKALLPVWATWLGERAGLPDHLARF